MDVTKALDTLRAEAPGCALVAFTDLSTGLVLSSSAAGAVGQEELDVLALAAQDVLLGTVGEGAQALFAGGTEMPPGTGITLTRKEARVYLRSPAGGFEALACLCAPGADLGTVAARGRETLEAILFGHGAGEGG